MTRPVEVTHHAIVRWMERVNCLARPTEAKRAILALVAGGVRLPNRLGRDISGSSASVEVPSTRYYLGGSAVAVLVRHRVVTVYSLTEDALASVAVWVAMRVWLPPESHHEISRACRTAAVTHELVALAHGRAA